jgi:hypothetical protein
MLIFKHYMVSEIIMNKQKRISHCSFHLRISFKRHRRRIIATSQTRRYFVNSRIQLADFCIQGLPGLLLFPEKGRMTDVKFLS